MKKFAPLAALALLPAFSVLFTAPVFADSPGQLSNGASNYKVRNVTTNGAYSQNITAACGDTVKYSITLSNSDFGLLRNLTVKANMASGVISASATNANDQTTAVSGNAKVNTSKGSLVYVPGSTVRITSDNSSTTALANGITASGVNAGNLNGSTATFVQFQATVDCPETPVTPQEPETPVTPETPATPVTPTELPKTGSEGVVAMVAAVLAAAAGYVVTARKNLLG